MFNKSELCFKTCFLKKMFLKTISLNKKRVFEGKTCFLQHVFLNVLFKKRHVFSKKHVFKHVSQKTFFNKKHDF